MIGTSVRTSTGSINPGPPGRVKAAMARTLSHPPTALTFTTSNYGEFQRVTVTGAQDEDTEDEDEQVTVVHDATGGGYRLSADYLVTVFDDDGDGVTLRELAVELSAAPAQIREDGGAVAVTVTAKVQDAVPAEDRTIEISIGQDGDAAVVGRDYEAVTPFPITIQSGATSGTGTFTLTPLDDSEPEGPEGITVSGSADGAAVRSTAFMLINDEYHAQKRLERINKAILAELSRAMMASTVDAVQARMAPDSAGGGSAPGPVEALTGALAARGEGLNDGAASLKDMLAGASFALSAAAADGGPGSSGAGGTTVWARGDYRNLDGSHDRVEWDGGLFAAHLGADRRFGSGVTAGVDLTWFEGALDYTYRDPSASAETGDENVPEWVTREKAGISGRHEAWIAGVVPYIGWSSPEGSSLWALLGYGRGEIEIEEDSARDKHDIRESADTSFAMTAAGGAARLYDDGKAALDLKGDLSTARYKVEGSGELIVDATAATHRARLALEGSATIDLGPGATLAPSASLGVRWDGGDGATGVGVELGGGLALEDPSLGAAARLEGRTLLAHAGDVREWGLGGSLAWNPTPGDRGLSLSLAPSWGAAESGGADRLWEQGVAAEAAQALDASGRLEAEAGYGFAALGGKGAFTPYAGLGFAGDGARRWRLGGRLETGPALSMSLEAERSEHDGRPAGHGVMLTIDLRW